MDDAPLPTGKGEQTNSRQTLARHGSGRDGFKDVLRAPVRLAGFLAHARLAIALQIAEQFDFFADRTEPSRAANLDGGRRRERISGGSFDEGQEGRFALRGAGLDVIDTPADTDQKRDLCICVALCHDVPKGSVQEFLNGPRIVQKGLNVCTVETLIRDAIYIVAHWLLRKMRNIVPPAHSVNELRPTAAVH